MIIVLRIFIFLAWLIISNEFEDSLTSWVHVYLKLKHEFTSIALKQYCMNKHVLFNFVFLLHLILFHAAMLFILKMIGWPEDGKVIREYT